MKKRCIALVLAVFVVAGLTALLVNYKTNDLNTPVICISVDENGNCQGAASKFTKDTDKVTFVCQKNKPFIKEATITWYSDNNNNTPVKTETVDANDKGYFISSFSKSEGLSSGDYHAYIDISYTFGSTKSVANFTIEK